MYDTPDSPKVPTPDELAQELDRLVRQSRRRRRYELKHWRRRNARRLGAGGGARSCGFAHDDVTIGVTRAGQSHVTGVKRCGSVWSCPVCAPTIREKRAEEIDTACRNWLASGGSVWFVSATVPHRQGDELVRTMTLAQDIWSRAWSGRSGKAVRDDLGIRHTVRAWDHTHGKNGWHPHFHALFFVQGHKFDPATVALQLREAWVAAGLGNRWVPTKSVDVRPVRNHADIGRYTTKVEGRWGAGLELARADLKRGHGITSAQVMELASCGEAWAVDAWLQWERATKGRRCIVWSRGARAELGLGDEVEDDELVEVAPEDEIIREHKVPRDEWNRYAEQGRTPELLERFEQGCFDFATVSDSRPTSSSCKPPP